jgi:hypothetical protein
MGTENRLIGAILIQAIKDWDHPEYRVEVQEFLRSRWFGELVEAIELEPADLRSMLKSGQIRPETLRAAYRKRIGGNQTGVSG